MAEEIYDILMLDIEDEIEIIVQKEDDVEESKKRIKKSDSYNQPSVPLDDVPVLVLLLLLILFLLMFLFCFKI